MEKTLTSPNSCNRTRSWTRKPWKYETLPSPSRRRILQLYQKPGKKERGGKIKSLPSPDSSSRLGLKWIRPLSTFPLNALHPVLRSQAPSLGLVKMLPISSARIAIGGARSLSYAGGKVLCQGNCHLLSLLGLNPGASNNPECGWRAVVGELDRPVDRSAQPGHQPSWEILENFNLVASRL